MNVSLYLLMYYINYYFDYVVNVVLLFQYFHLQMEYHLLILYLMIRFASSMI